MTIMAETKGTGVQGADAGHTTRALEVFQSRDLRLDAETTTADRARLIRDAFCSPDALDGPDAWKTYLQLSGSDRRPLAILLRDCSLSGSVFSRDNPIHDFLGIESEMGNAQVIRNAYRTVGELLAKVKKSLPSSSYPKTAEKAQACLKAVYGAIKAAGIKAGSEDGVPFFHRGIADKVLDCDTSTMVVLAIAHEMKWPVYPVKVPGHVFARWDDGAGTRLNIDYGKIHDDDHYMTWPRNISKESVGKGVYLKNLTRGEMQAIIYTTRANAKGKLGRHKEAIADYDTAIELDPKYASAYCNRGIARGKLGRHKEAIADYDTAIGLDPKYASAYYGRAFAERALNRIGEAIADYDKAIELDPKYASAYYNRADAKGELGRHREAIADYDTAIGLDPKYASAYYNRAIAKGALNRIGEAIADYDKAVELDPKDASAYYNRAIAKGALDRIGEAIADYDKAVELDPNFASTYHARAIDRCMDFYNLTEDRTALFVNFAVREMIGTHVAMMNFAGQKMSGKQSSVFNTVVHDMTGVQLAVMMNAAVYGNMKGVQVGLVNAAVYGNMEGVQVGLVNQAINGDMKGLQIGAINYAGGKMESAWGILNLSARCNFYVASPFGGDTCVFGQKDGL